MLRRPSLFRVGPNPDDQREEREARIAEILGRARRHTDKAEYQSLIERRGDEQSTRVAVARRKSR
jgi:hypothetical protein